MSAKIVLIAAALSAAPALGASPTDKPKTADASIPFANFGGINDWRADGDNAIYIQGRSRKDWYRATLFGPCIGLPFAEKVGFVSEPSGSFDKFSSIVVRGQECQVQTLVKLDGPPPAKAKK